MINAGLKNLLQQAKMATKEENQLLKGKLELLESDIKSTKKENDEEKRYLQEQHAKTLSENSASEMLLRKKLEQETQKLKEVEDKYRNENKEREKNQALQGQRIFFMEKDMKGMSDQLEASESTVQDLRDRLAETERSQQSFISKNDSTIKEMQL